MNNQIYMINVEDIIPNRFQPRKNFDETETNELAQSIKQHGIIQPLVLRRLGNKFEIIAGERRYKASKIVGLSQVPSIIMELDDQKSAEIALAENIQRKDLTAIEKAKSYQQILNLGQMSQTELAAKMGKSQPSVSNALRLLELSDEVQKAILDNQISERHARSLLSIKDKNKQNEMLNNIIQNRMTVRETDIAIKNMLNNNLENSQNNNTEEIIDFDSDNNLNSTEEIIEDDIKDPVEDYNNNDMIQNINNFNNNGVVDNLKNIMESPSEAINNIQQMNNANIKSIPEFDQININNNPTENKFYNLDDEEANMNIDNNIPNNDFQMINNQSNDNYNNGKNNLQNYNVQQNENIYTPQNNMNQPQYNQFEQYNQPQNSMYQNGGMYNPQMNNSQPQYNQMEQYNPQQNGNIYTPQNNMNQPQFNGYNNSNSYNPNEPQNINLNNYSNPQNNAIYPNNNVTEEIDEPVEPQAMIAQQDITGAVAVIRNTIMNLQNNGYLIEVNEADLNNLYKISIDIKK